LLGAVGALALLFHASKKRPPLLMAIFVVWILLPLAVLSGIDRLSHGWSPRKRGALYTVMVIIALFSLGVYAEDAFWPRKAHTAFVYVLVPPACCLLTAVVMAIVAFRSRKRSGVR